MHEPDIIGECELNGCSGNATLETFDVNIQCSKSQKEKMSTILDLPIEILGMIFPRLDGISFLQAIQVCKSWRHITMDLEKKYWMEACKREIHPNVLEELVSYAKLEHFKDTNPIWKNIYKLWFMGSAIKKKPVVHSFVHDRNPVTCIKASGSWILTGHRSGSVCGWDQTTGDGKTVFVQHLNMINNFVLVDLLHAGPYGSIDKPWNHHHIISISKDPTIQMNSLLSSLDGYDEHHIVYHHGCGFEAIRVFDDLIAVSASDQLIFIFKMEYVKEPLHHLKVSLLHQLFGPADVLWDLGFWHDKLQYLCTNGVRKVCAFHSTEWGIVNPYIVCKWPDQEEKEYEKVSIASSFLFREDITFFITVDGQLLISIDGQKYYQYNLMATIKTAIVCLTLYSSILALGTENGRLLLYHVPKPSNLKQLDLASPSISLTLSEASIVSVDISYSNDYPLIVASTTECMFLVTWYNPSTTVIKPRSIASIFSQPTQHTTIINRLVNR